MPKTIIMSATSLKTFMSCRRLYWFTYVQKLKPIRRTAPLSMGSAVHAGQEFIFKNPDRTHGVEEVRAAIAGSYTPDELAESGVEPLVAMEMVAAFERHVPWRDMWEFVAVEPEFEASFGVGRKVIGRYDGIIRRKMDGSLWILEHKTVSGRVDDRRLNHLLWDVQASMYVASARSLGHQVAGILYNFLPKPTFEKALATPQDKIKYTQEKSRACPECKKKDAPPGPHFLTLESGDVVECKNGRFITEAPRLFANMRLEDESDAEYLARVRAWYDENGPDPMFFRQHPVMRNKSQVDMLISDVKKITTDIRACERDGSYYMNPSHCQMMSCPYASVCLEDTPEVRAANFCERGRGGK